MSDRSQIVASHRCRINGINIHYLSTNNLSEDLPYAICCHGGFFDAATLTFRKLMERLAARFRVVALDWPGYGDSDRPRVSYSMEFFLGILGEFLDRLNIHKTSLIGISMGGGISLGFTLRFPERIDKLVLVAPYGLASEIPPATWPYLAGGYLPLKALGYRFLSSNHKVVRFFLRDLVSNPAKIKKSEIDEIVRQVRKPHMGRAFHSWLQSEITMRGFLSDYSKELPKLSKHTLFIQGDRDVLIPSWMARRAQALVPRSRLEIYSHCGHWPPHEHPNRFTKDVMEFLTSTV